MEITEPAGRRRYDHAPRLPGEGALAPRTFFSASGPIELEIGSAGGGFLIERLAAAPEVCLVGLEIRKKPAALSMDKIVRLKSEHRCRIFAADVREALPRFEAASLERVFINFPDPWWKKRHAKRRLTSADLFHEVARVLCPGGELFIQTDVEERAQAFSLAVRGTDRFAEIAPDGRLGENPYGARSPRERQALLDGLPVFRLGFRRLPPSGR